MRRAKPLLDVGQATLLMWDGRRDALFNQVFTPIESPAEMNSARLFVAQEVLRRYRADYEALFGPLPPLSDATRFPQLTPAQAGCHEADDAGRLECHGKPGDGAEFDHLSRADQDAVTRVVANMGKAIGAYLRKLSCGVGRFDAWVHGDSSALTAGEKHGAEVFLGAGCASCHSGPFFSDQQFHNVGLAPVPVVVAFIDRDDRGAAVGLAAILDDPLNTRGQFSDGDDQRLPSEVTPAMEGAFRTPTLRCVAQRPSFMHTGQYRSLDAVIEFFNRGGDPTGFMGTTENIPRNLSAEDVTDLVAFLKTLDGAGPEASLRTAP